MQRIEKRLIAVILLSLALMMGGFRPMSTVQPIEVPHVADPGGGSGTGGLG